MEFSERFRALRKKAGLTQDELADKLGLTRPAVSIWESGGSRPRLDKLSQIADIFGVTVSELLGESEAQNILPTSRMVPILGTSHMGEYEDEDVCDRLVEVPASVADAHPGGFCVHAQGDCMDNRYPCDSILLIDPHMTPFNGCAVLAETEDYQSIVRVYSRGQSTLMLAADSHSDSYDDIIVKADDAPVTLKGVVVWYQAEEDLR